MDEFKDWIAALPKIELHCHLEGAIPLPALWHLVERYGCSDALNGIEDLEQRFRFKDFSHFIKTWIWKNQFLRDYDDFEWIAEAVARDLAQQNILYAELFYSPSSFLKVGLEPMRLTAAIRRGFERVPEVAIRLIVDFVRDLGPEHERLVLEALDGAQELGVIGIGIGGSEHSFPPAPFATLFARAREMGFHLTAHAGEAAGPTSIWSALRDLKVERIGHGTRAREDETLLEFLKARGIPIECCPISNLRTGICADLAQHPIRSYFDRGLLVCVNSDDPKMFNNSLAEEYLRLHQELAFSRKEIVQLIRNAVVASWMDEPEKADFLRTHAAAWDAGLGV